MLNLRNTLEADPGRLPAIAETWRVPIENMRQEAAVQALYVALQDAARAERVWDALSDPERAALQMLAASEGSKMSLSMFERLHGKLRKLGRGLVEKEKPHQKPQSVAEALYYRGFIGEGFEQNKKGDMQPIVYVPPELPLPLHKTVYSNLETTMMDDTASAVEPLPEEDIEGVRQANTTVVDDLTTLLAYLRINSAKIEGDTLTEADHAALQPHLLTSGERRLAFLFGVGVSADLITTQEGQAYPKRDGLQKWLSASRAQQVKMLTEAWQRSTAYRELWHVPGLHPDPTGFPYDVQVARDAFIDFVRDFVPAEGWWSLDDFIETIKATDPDFQRPAGDYESWYIRNDAGEYLKGYESWDTVERALLEFYVVAPLHWLGLCDVADGAARLTAYGRAFLGHMDWPQPPEPQERIQVHDDGKLIASRKVSRVDRFQVARFTSWQEPYTYQLDADGLQQAQAQGITPQHITTFLSRQIDADRLPPGILRILTMSQDETTRQITFERLHVLRTLSQEVLDKIYNEPELRRFLGGRLGPTAGTIREGQADDLQAALTDAGLDVEIVS